MTDDTKALLARLRHYGDNDRDAACTLIEQQAEDLKARHQRQHDAEAMAGEYLMQRDDARAELERLREQNECGWAEVKRLAGERDRLTVEASRLRAQVAPAGWWIVQTEGGVTKRWPVSDAQLLTIGLADPNAGLGIPSCGGPLCGSDHHPLCPQAPAAGNVATAQQAEPSNPSSLDKPQASNPAQQAEAQAAHDNAILERGIQLGMYRERQRAEALAQQSPSLTVGERVEPFWYAVVSQRAPVINKAFKREDVAQEWADKCIEPDVEVVPLYRAPPPHPAAQAEPVAGIKNHEMLVSLIVGRLNRAGYGYQEACVRDTLKHAQELMADAWPFRSNPPAQRT